MNKPDEDCSTLMPSSHEEIDTHMFIHINDAFTKGFNKIVITCITVDTDVFVLAI